MQYLNTLAIQQSLIEKISKLTGIAQARIQTTTPLAEYGLDSVHAVGLSGDIEDWLGITVEPTIAWDFPTIEEMAAYLASQIENIASNLGTNITLQQGV